MGNVMCSPELQGQNYKRKQRCKPLITQSQLKQMTSNKVVATYNLGQCAEIVTILGNYKMHNGDVLVRLTTLEEISFCEQMRQYALNLQQSLTKIQQQQKQIHKIKVSQDCPYKSLLVCLTPQYELSYNQKQKNPKNEQQRMDRYSKSLISLAEGIVYHSREVTLCLKPTVVMPTQIILGVLFRYLTKYEGRAVRITIVSPLASILQTVRYEIVKIGSEGEQNGQEGHPAQTEQSEKDGQSELQETS